MPANDNFLAKTATLSLDALAVPTTVAAVGAVADNRMTSKVPKKCRISIVEIQLTSIALASTVTFFLCRKSNGDEAFTPKVTKTITAGITANTGTVVEFFERQAYVWDDGDDGVYVGVALDAGTATAEVRVTGDVQ